MNGHYKVWVTAMTSKETSQPISAPISLRKHGSSSIPINKRVALQPSFILHSRPYRDSSMLIEAFTQDHGRVCLIGKGVKSKKSSTQGNLQVFVPLLLSWSGRGEIHTLTNSESNGKSLLRQGRTLLSGYYLNELLMRLMHRHDPHAALFEVYAQTLKRLATEENSEPVLRRFEVRLLQEIGYGLTLDHDVETGTEINSDACYAYHIEKGPVEVNSTVGDDLVVRGSTLLALLHNTLDDATNLQEAKRLLRFVLTHHLGGKPLNTRQVQWHKVM